MDYFGLYLIAPVLHAFISVGSDRRGLYLGISISAWTVATFMAIGISNYFGYSRHIDRGALTMWIFFVGYFVMGFALKNFKQSPLSTVAFFLVAVLLLAELVWQNSSTHVPRYIPALNSGNALGIVCTIASSLLFIIFLNSGPLIEKLRIARPLATLSDLAFGVFCIHLFFLALVVKHFGIEKVSEFSFASVTYLVVVLSSFGAAAIFKKLPILRRLF